MSTPDENPRQRGKRLLKRINRWAIAAAVALAGLFSFVAAETSHGKTTNSTTTSLQQPASSPSSSSSSTSSNSGNTGSSSSGTTNTGSSGSSGSSNSGSSSIVSGGS